jgi:transposase-like protein
VNLVGEGGPLSGLVKLVLEGALEAELTEHLGYEKGDGAGGADRVEPVGIEVPRDRRRPISRRFTTWRSPGT